MKLEIIKQNVGVDVGKDDLRVALSNLTNDYRVIVSSTRTFANTRQGFKQLQDWLVVKRHSDFAVSFTMEATGVYYEGLAYFLFEHAYVVHVVLPTIAKKYAQSLGIKSKTDKLDASTLSKMGLERQLRVWQPVSSSLLGLKQLTRERDALVCSRTTTANQLHAYRHQGKPNKHSIKRSEKLICFLDKHIKQIEKEIEVFVNQDEQLKHKNGIFVEYSGSGAIDCSCHRSGNQRIRSI